MSMVSDATGVKGRIASFGTVEARTSHNIEVAARVMAAGVPVVPLKEQAPLALAFPRLDSTIAPADRADIVAAWQAEKGHTRQPFHVGSTVDSDRLNAWHSGRRDWTLGFGCSPGLVEAVVIDCDDEGGASLLAYLAQHGESVDLAQTPITVSGGRKGWHVWFANPGGEWGCPKIKPDILADVKGRGGQVLLPGMVLSPKAYDGVMSGPRHYQPLAGTPGLVETLRAGTLPPLPVCLAALMDRNGGAEADPTDERSTYVRAALVALRGDPTPACMARDTLALVEALRAKDAAFDKLWREGDDDGSNGRFRVAQALVREYGSNGFEVHDLRDAFGEWDHAIKGNPITDREVARCYGKAAENFGPRNDGGSMGPVVDDDEPETSQIDQHKVERALAWGRMRSALALDDGVLEAGAALLDACEGLKERTRGKVALMLLQAQRGELADLPNTLDEFVNPPKPDGLPRGIALPDDDDNFADLDSIPPTPWLVYPIFARGVVGALGGPAGVAKTRLAFAEAMAVVTGRPEIAGWSEDTRPERSSVWFHCQEDDLDELERKRAALARYHKLDRAEMDGTKGFRFYLTSGIGKKGTKGTPITLAWRDASKRPVENPELGRIIARIKAKRIGLFILDPAVELHDLDENNAAEMRVVWGAARRIAAETGCHVLILAHTRKPEGPNGKSTAGDMNVLRGSGAVAGVIRMARTVLTMSETDAAANGVETRDRHKYMRVDDAKNNLGPMRPDARWFHRFEVRWNDDRRADVAITVPHVFDAKAGPTRSSSLAERVAAVLRALGPGRHLLRDVVPAIEGLAADWQDAAKWPTRFKEAVMRGKAECEVEGAVLRYGAKRGNGGGAGVELLSRNGEAFGAVKDD